MDKAQVIENQNTGNNPVLAVVGIGTLLSAMAASTVSLALPVIGENLNADIGGTTWVMQSFLLAVTVLLLPSGKAGDLFGHKRIYLTGFLLFAITSLLCALATGIWQLIVMRILQGIGGAMIMATGPALLTTSFPGKQRGKALGILATATYVGLTAGPPLGGLLIQHFGWRSVFFLNIPVALVILLMGLVFLPQSKRLNSEPFDFVGMITLLLGLPLLLLSIGQGVDWGFTSIKTVSAFSFGLFGLVAFFIIENSSSHPLLQLKLFASRTFSGATLAALFNYIAIFVQIILLPYYLIEGIGLDASKAGIILSAQPLLMAISASPSGWLSDRIGSKWLSVVGLVGLSIGLFGLSTVNMNSSEFTVAGWLAIMGLGTGIFISPNSSALMGSAPKKLQGTAGAVLGVARNLGMMLGVAMGTFVFRFAGGSTGIKWSESEFSALQYALIVAGVASLLGALASFVTSNKVSAKI